VLATRTYRGSNLPDAAFRVMALGAGLLVVLLVALMVSEMAAGSALSFSRFGLGFLASSRWDPQQRLFGSLPFIYGTVVSSFIGLAIATPIGVGAAIFVVELAPTWLGNAVSALVELLAAIPSVLLGLWGVVVMVPLVRSCIEQPLIDALPNVPFLAGPAYGVGLLAGGLILAVMVIPTIVAISRDAMAVVPKDQREAMLALGATRWEATTWAVLPYARSGILGAAVLGLGRALGETMAVTMVIGNRPEIPASLFQPAYTMASVIANEFTEATFELYISALIEIGLVLFLVTVALNAAARLLVWRAANAAG
jgi:phosphate transport system permease protein